MFKHTILIATIALFVSCGGGSGDTKKEEPNVDKNPIIVKKTDDLKIDTINKNSAFIRFDAKNQELKVKYYKLTIKSLSSQKNPKSYIGIDIGKDCKQISQDTKECLILAKKELKEYTLMIGGLKQNYRYYIWLDTILDDSKNDENSSQNTSNDVNKTSETSTHEEDRPIDTNSSNEENHINDTDKTNTPHDENQTSEITNEDQNSTIQIVKLNQAPKAFIAIKNEYKNILFDGSSSIDKDGDIINYQWFLNGNFLSNKDKFYKRDLGIGTYDVSLKVTDDKNATNTQTTKITVKDTTKPKVVSFTPTNSTDIALDTKIEINFSKKIELPNLSNIRLIDENGLRFDIKTEDILLDSNETKLTILPSQNLKSHTTYTLFLDIEDKFQNVLLNEKILSFKTIDTRASSISINLTGWDDSTSKVQISIEIENQNHQFELSNILLNENAKETLSKKVLIGKRYKFELKSKQNICKIDKNQGQYFISDGEDINLNIDCRAKIRLETTAELTQNIEFKENKSFKIFNTQMKLEDDNSNINSDKFIYSSSDESIATISKDGYVVLKSIGEVKINVDVDSRYYLTSNIISFDLNIQSTNSNIKIQDIQMGQTTILSVDDKFHQLAAEKETIIRAYIYSLEKNTTHPKTTISFKKEDGEEFTKQMTCPAILQKGAIKNSESEGYNYNINDTCYTIMQTDEEKSFITPNVKIKVNIDKIKKEVTPKISHKRYLNIYLIKGKTKYQNSSSSSSSTYEYIANVNDEDIQNIGKFLLNIFPVSEVNIRVRKEPYELGVILAQALSDTSKLYDTERRKNEYLYAIVPASIRSPEEVIGVASGLSRLGVGISVGRDKYFNADYIKTLAHELGHAFGLKHSTCGIGIQQIDYYWIRYAKNWQYENRGMLSKSPVYISESKRVVNPWDYSKDKDIRNSIGQPADLMGYCNGNRLTKRFYQRVSNYYMDNEPQFDTPSYEDSVKISKSLKPKTYKMIFRGNILLNKVVLDPVSITSNTLHEDFPTKDEYKVLVDADGKEIFYPFSIFSLDHINTKSFEIILPMAKNIKSIKFFKNNKELKHIIKGYEKAQNLDTNITYKNGLISWTNYKYLSAVFSSNQTKEKTLIANNVENKIFKPQKTLENGVLEVVVSDGLNSKVKIFHVK